MHLGGSDHFLGENFPPKWPVCNTARVCGRQSLRTNVYRLNIHKSNTIWEVLQYLSSMPWRSSLKPRDDTSPIAALLQLVTRILSTKSTDDLVDKLLFYEDDLPIPTSLRSEIISWHRKWRNVQHDARPDNFVEAAKQADWDFYPNVRKLLIIGCTLPVGSCEAERSFSFFRRIKTCLRKNIWEELGSPPYH